MNRDQFAGKWREFKGKVKEKWGKLTDDDIIQINGQWDQLSGKLQKKYGWAKEQAEREINNWCISCEQMKSRKTEGMNREENNLFRGNQTSNKHETRNERVEGHGTNEQQQWRQGKEQREKKHPEKDDYKNKKRKSA